MITVPIILGIILLTLLIGYLVNLIQAGHNFVEISTPAAASKQPGQPPQQPQRPQQSQQPEQQPPQKQQSPASPQRPGGETAKQQQKVAAKEAEMSSAASSCRSRVPIAARRISKSPTTVVDTVACESTAPKAGCALKAVKSNPGSPIAVKSATKTNAITTRSFLEVQQKDLAGKKKAN